MNRKTISASLLATALVAGMMGLGTVSAPANAEEVPMTNLSANAVNGSITWLKIQRKDKKGKWVPADGAVVTVFLQGSSFSRSAVANRDGSLTMAGLPLGSYRATASWNNGERKGQTSFSFSKRLNVKVDSLWRLN